MRGWFATLVLVAGMAAPAAAQVPSGARFGATTLDVTGHGETRLAPDMATIGLSVEADAPDAAQALEQASASMARVLAALRAGGIAARDIQSSEVGLAPQYAYANGQAPRLTGYQADDGLTVRVEDLARLGATVDAAVKAGATNVGSIQFGLKNSAEAESLASLAAIKALEDKAQAYATAAGYRIGRLVNLRESGAAGPEPPRPMAAPAMARAGMSVPVEPGEITVAVDVTGEFELSR